MAEARLLDMSRVFHSSQTMTTGTLFLPPNAVKKITPFGVCGDDMLVLPNENEVKFYGENKDVCEHDESCRIFMGAIKGSSFCAPGVPLLSHDIAWDAEFGVLKVRVSPPGSNISSE
ncbi:BnaC02g32960D [Brassica napus]|uniref:BnaC02g32960D protein n=1 Tax=Brassica napus TaxID=3708 RepID=A0A078HYL3_BRANA|nr:BnaC02g32960D [Brassica napus]